MEEQNHIDKALAFLESLEKHADLSRKSKSLQDIIDKWRPIYLERMEMVKSVQMEKRKRTKKK